MRFEQRLYSPVLSELTRRIKHTPTVDAMEGPIAPTPYLRLPFTRESLKHVPTGTLGIETTTDYDIHQGWYYATDVKKYFPFGHGAVDYELPYGHPVAAPCDGYAMSSYHAYPFLDTNGSLVERDGINLRFGIGYFVQIYNPSVNRIVQLGHLSDVAPQIPFSKPEWKAGRWEATGHLLTPEQMQSSPDSVVYVNAGDPVGLVGFSGLTSEEDYVEGADRPYVIPPDLQVTWSIPHIHMDDSQRNYETGQKEWRRDPYCLYNFRDVYPTHTNGKSLGREPLFLTDSAGLPLFADQ